MPMQTDNIHLTVRVLLLLSLRACGTHMHGLKFKMHIVILRSQLK